MNYTTYQIIILLDDLLNINRKRNISKEIKRFIEEITQKTNIKYAESRDLAYKVNEHQNAWFVVLQLKLKNVGANKRIKEIEEKINTYEEIIDFKIIQCNKKIDDVENENSIYLVYEFDYGDISQGIEPNITIFEGFTTRENAVQKANELLQEGLEKYFIDSSLIGNNNPFKDNNEVHLYENELEKEQRKSVYYIKIEKINLKEE